MEALVDDLATDTHLLYDQMLAEFAATEQKLYDYFEEEIAFVDRTAQNISEKLTIFNEDVETALTSVKGRK